MNATAGARDWMAAGVRHELLARTLPTVRHDLAAPMQVMRMALLVFKRQLTADTVGAPAWQERMGTLEQNLGSLIAGVRSLRDWDLAATDTAMARSALVAQCAALMRPCFEVNGAHLSIDDALLPQDGEPLVASGCEPRYLCLGALGYLQDNAPQCGEVRIEADGAQGLRFVAQHHAASVPCLDHLPRPRRKLTIDAPALQCLADDLGLRIQIQADAVQVALAPG
jgi:hypothetical protein